MKVHGPDGRIWQVARRTDPPSTFGAFNPRARWIVEADTGDERRVWVASSRGAAKVLVDEVALALRTGAEGPPGELPPAADPPDDGA